MARARNRISFEPLESRLLLNGQTLTGLGQTAGGWSDPSNWSGGASGAYPGSDNQADTLVFSAANYSGFYNTANNNLSNLSLAGIEFIGDNNGSTNAFTLTGNAVTLTGPNGLQLSNAASGSGGNTYIATVGLAGVKLGATDTWLNSCGTLDVTAPVNLNGNTLTLNGALASGATGPTQTTFGGGITGLTDSGSTPALENTGGGVLTISAGSQGLAGSTTLLADTGSTISDAPIAYSRIAGKRPDRQPRWPDCQVRCG